MFPELCQAVLVDIAQSGPGEHLSADCFLLKHNYRCPFALEGGWTYTLAAHLVTLRPSFMHSVSPRPLASVLHIM